MSELNKIFRPAGDQSLAMAQVYERHYGNSLNYIQRMSDILKKDFGVENEDIKINKFGGNRLKGIIFVEVQLGKIKKAPEDYTVVKDIESIL